MEKYQVLARKYRPQNFFDVVGQETIVTTLKNALRFERVAHAYLFSGSRGTGKTTLVRLFSKALNCSNLKENQEPCNACASCLEITNGQSLDVIEIDGASNRGIDDIREINEMVGYVPSHGKYKIYIIDEVHMLTKEAFNALLKTLEEPPAQAKFFFATTEPHKVLPTIISRCQRFDLGRISPSGIIKKLEHIAQDLSREVDPEAFLKIADLSDGSLRDAESLFDQVLCFTEENVSANNVREIFGLVSDKHFFELDLAFSEVNLSFAFELIDHLFQSGKDLSHFMHQLIDHYRLITLAKTLGEASLPAAIAARYMTAAQLYTKQQSLYLLEYLIIAQGNLQKSLSPRIFLETTLLHIIRSKNRIPVEVLIRRLSELEGKESKEPEAKKAPLAPPPKEIPQTPPKEKILKETPKEQVAPKKTLPQTPPEEKILKDTPKEQVAPKETLPQTPPEEKILKETPKEQVAPKKTLPQTPLEEKGSDKHPSHYDTLMRFAAVELEGSLKI